MPQYPSWSGPPVGWTIPLNIYTYVSEQSRLCRHFGDGPILVIANIQLISVVVPVTKVTCSIFRDSLIVGPAIAGQTQLQSTSTMLLNFTIILNPAPGLRRYDLRFYCDTLNAVYIPANRYQVTYLELPSWEEANPLP